MSRRLAVVLAAAVALALLEAGPAAAQEAVKVKANRTPLRAEPTSASAAVTFFQAGTTLQVIESREGWYRVREPKTRLEGFIMAVLVEPLAAGGAVKPGAGRQVPASPARPKAPPKPSIGVRAVADVGAVWFTASESFDAVTGSNRRMQYGGGLQVVNFWKGLFAEAIVGRSRLTGSRVVYYQGTTYDLGVPTTITFTPVDAGLGWRVALGKRAHSYVGGGVTLLQYRETSDFAADGENVDESHTGYYACAGLEYSLTKWLHLRGEARVTSVANAIGQAGVSKDFEENNLGGLGVAVKLAIGK
ncbi:MAG TPA: SH3 domain-containing protein [Vicinamibacterales bacterium]|nr:SH3 domain-containing protein [Vicinamibacterales bacterium]HPW20970.1 SH3 domain-containing protein [Vicinamibacterales bacterium]